MDRGVIPQDSETQEVIFDFFLFLTAPEALNPDGWFQKLPGYTREAMRVLCATWHTRYLAMIKMNSLQGG